VTTAEEVTGKVLAACRYAMLRYPVGHVSDGVAKVIASQWHDGPTTALHAFSAVGAIHDQEQLLDEIDRELTRQKKAEHVNEDAVDVLNCLTDYVIKQSERGPVDGWADLWVK
jgi:hypothetical protein